MKKRSKSSRIAASVLCVSLSGACIAEQAQPEEEFLGFIGPEPFQVCFDEHYYDSEVSAEQAYARAECFSQLLDKNVGGSEAVSQDKIMLLRQYTDSWLLAAAERGHSIAKQQLESNRVALSSFDYKGLNSDSQQLASEKEFEEIDTDHNGFLNKWETVEHNDLYATFTTKDLDADGIVSREEFMIFYGEATAAGMPQE